MPRGRGRRTKVAVAVGLIVVLIVVLMIVLEAMDSRTQSETGSQSQFEGVTISSCGPPTELGVVYVQGEAENTSSERSDFTIEVGSNHPTESRSGLEW